MRNKTQKNKQYFIDSKQHTTKKQKKTHDTLTPIQLSISHNHHKYIQSIDLQIQEQNTAKKQTISVNQLKMLLRCLQKYCNTSSGACSQSKECSIASKIYYFLRQKYRVIGDVDQIKQIQRSIKKLTRQDMLCELCNAKGQRCKQMYIKHLNQKLPEEVKNLQSKLEQLLGERELYLDIIKRSEIINKQRNIKEMKKQIKLQEQMLRRLDEEIGQGKQKAKRKQPNLQIFIQNDEI